MTLMQIRKNLLLPENPKVVTTKMQLFRRADCKITFPKSFYAHVHILCQLEPNNCKTTKFYLPSGTLCQYNLSYRKMDLKSRYNPK